MSIPERLFRISKAYLNQVRDRIDSELSDAERELNAATSHDNPSRVSPPPPPRDLSESEAESLMQRAEAKIASAWRELEARQSGTPNAAQESEAASGTIPAAPAAGGTRPSYAPPTPAAATGGVSVPPINGGANSGSGMGGDDPNASDFRVLGVPVGSDLATVQSAYEKLARRCDPRRFPEGSSEQADASRILGRINVSYEALRKRLDPTVNRFGKLELE